MIRLKKVALLLLTVADEFFRCRFEMLCCSRGALELELLGFRGFDTFEDLVVSVANWSYAMVHSGKKPEYADEEKKP